MEKEDLMQLPAVIDLKGRGLDRSVWLNSRPLSPERSLSIAKHSLDGFNWSYEGSGPAQLALAVCLNIMSEHNAVRYYQLFKAGFIAQLNPTNFWVRIRVREYFTRLINNEKMYLEEVLEVLDPEQVFGPDGCITIGAGSAKNNGVDAKVMKFDMPIGGA